LQEVQGTTTPNKDDHFTELKDALAGLGYDVGAYGRLTGSNGCELGTESKSKSKKKPHIGNAIFIRTETWQYVDHGRISFAQLLAERCKGNDAQRKHYSAGQQVAVWTRLVHIPTKRIVVAVSVHIGANWRNPDTQIAQIDAMLGQLEAVVQEGESLIICGDFNSQPNGGAYEYMSTGRLSADHPEVLPKVAEVQKLCDDQGFRTCLKLDSAYATLFGFEPEFTSMAGPAPDKPDDITLSLTLDYMWYSAATLQPALGTALRIPTVADASKENAGLPNSVIPSDHIPLGLAVSFVPSVGDTCSKQGCQTPERSKAAGDCPTDTPDTPAKVRRPPPESLSDQKMMPWSDGG
jgi:endonuclease/exonuclease/phosphatase family metal-dependent hydrolase